jgi:hypothetical protein
MMRTCSSSENRGRREGSCCVGPWIAQVRAAGGKVLPPCRDDQGLHHALLCASTCMGPSLMPPPTGGRCTQLLGPAWCRGSFTRNHSCPSCCDAFIGRRDSRLRGSTTSGACLATRGDAASDEPRALAHLTAHWAKWVYVNMLDPRTLVAGVGARA